MKTKLEGLTKNRLKRSSFVHEAKKIKREMDINIPTTPLDNTDIYNPHESDLSSVKISTEVTNLDRDTSDIVKCSISLAQITENCPPTIWTHVYTDGSATDAVKDGGAGIVIQCTDGQPVNISIPTGVYCTNYQAEVEALQHAVHAVKDLSKTGEKVVFLTDALSVLEALQNNKLPKLSKALQELASDKEVSLQWIPAHCGIPGNEKADQMAKTGARQQQLQTPVSYKEKCSIVKALFSRPQNKDAYHLLPRPGQVTIFRLRTGHNRLNAHMYKKLHLVQSAKCPCGEADQTTEHLLQTCMMYKVQRERVWPKQTKLDTKLYGTIEDLLKTLAFIDAAGVTV